MCACVCCRHAASPLLRGPCCAPQFLGQLTWQQEPAAADRSSGVKRWNLKCDVCAGRATAASARRCCAIHGASSRGPASSAQWRQRRLRRAVAVAYIRLLLALPNVRCLRLPSSGAPHVLLLQLPVRCQWQCAATGCLVLPLLATRPRPAVLHGLHWRRHKGLHNWLHGPNGRGRLHGPVGLLPTLLLLLLQQHEMLHGLLHGLSWHGQCHLSAHHGLRCVPLWCWGRRLPSRLHGVLLHEARVLRSWRRTQLELLRRHVVRLLEAQTMPLIAKAGDRWLPRRAWACGWLLPAGGASRRHDSAQYSAVTTATAATVAAVEHASASGRLTAGGEHHPACRNAACNASRAAG